jgi:amino acid transporter
MAEDSPFSLKRLLLGKPIPSHLAHHERLSRVTGLAVLSSDALSSVAYATDFILTTLLVAGVGAFSYAVPISLVIATLLAVVAFSYRQTIFAYPRGGGAYIVAKENIAQSAGLVAAASLLVDYTLTVAVSISAGVLAITSAFPELDAYRVELCLTFLALLTVGNLRGIRESGRIFAVPTYFFVCTIGVLILIGMFRYFTGSIVPVVADLPPEAGTKPLTTFLLLTAFANGCTAMTGVEAVSDGVPAFRPPESKNAAATLVAMAVMGIAMFIGITVLAHVYQVVPNKAESGVSQLGRAVFGGQNIPYYLLQAATTLILVLAANTAYADFPRLASIVSRDGFLPRQFMNQGDRLAFSNGILILALFAGILILVFGGDTQSLLPLYMIGVFISFTLSQTGMVLRWRKTRDPERRMGAVINGFGALLTGVVLIIVAVTKTHEGGVDRSAPDSDHRLSVQGDSPPLRPRGRPAHAARLRAATARPQHGARADRRRAAVRGRGASLRRNAVERRPRGLRGRRPGRDREREARLGKMGRAGEAHHPGVALPIADGTAARVHRAGRKRTRQRLRHGHPARIRAGALVATPPP